MKTNYAGIDYGLGKTNVGAANIRYGVINQNDVGESWYDKAEGHYGNPMCPECEGTVIDSSQSNNELADKEYFCQNCLSSFWAENVFPESPLSFYVDNDEYSAECSENGDIFITKSPYFTYAQFCSPCAPGACYLMNELTEPNENNKCFCFGPEWFEDGKAPYNVWRVSDGGKVN